MKRSCNHDSSDDGKRCKTELTAAKCEIDSLRHTVLELQRQLVVANSIFERMKAREQCLERAAMEAMQEARETKRYTFNNDVF